MIIADAVFNEMFDSVARRFVGRVELLEGSTLINTFEYDGDLQSFVIDKAGSKNRLFGYGICHKATVKLRDKERKYNIERGHHLEIAHGIGNDYIYCYPQFTVTEVKRDENTNALTITAYDALEDANNKFMKDLVLPEAFNLELFINACAAMIGVPVRYDNVNTALLKTYYVTSTTNHVNYSGKESIREALDDIAEVLGAIYYIDKNWNLTFKVLGGAPVLHIDKSKYFTLTAKTAHTVAAVESITSLGDNVIASSNYEGEVVVFRENMLISLRDDIDTVLNRTLAAVSGLTIYQYECKHRGNFLLELGDKIALTTKDNEIIETYCLKESIKYDGGLSATLSWSYDADDRSDYTNSATLGDALKETYARVDKANGKITLLADSVSKLELSSEGIQATIEKMAAENDLMFDNTNAQIENILKQLQATLTEEQIEILIRKISAHGTISSVMTETGFTFDENGLSISKSGSPIGTIITENGMRIELYGNPMLTVNSDGVNAQNLHATTYLSIGTLSRFQDWNGYTACFWLGE